MIVYFVPIYNLVYKSKCMIQLYCDNCDHICMSSPNIRLYLKNQKVKRLEKITIIISIFNSANIYNNFLTEILKKPDYKGIIHRIEIARSKLL